MSGKIRVTFECDDSAGLVAFAKGLLEEEGYVVARPEALHAKETPSQFCARLGISAMTWSRRIRLAHCPANFESERGPSGRVLWLRASRELEEFMKPLNFSTSPADESAAADLNH